ncbi:MAG: hypothetical protein NTU53_04960 [Planctomycetota bacterium]|nr:hypothetical protein [Planctomycetota bacterium]
MSIRPSDPASVVRDLNSRNHAGVGQNVLYVDGHVIWSATTFCGSQGENIFLVGTGDKQMLGERPETRDDSVLLPRGEQWFQ